MKKNIYRKVVLSISAVHILIFFLLPYGRSAVGEMLGGLGSLSGISGTSAYPASLTGFHAVKMILTLSFFVESDEMALYLIVFGFPALMAIAVLLMNVFGKGRLSYVGGMILSFLMTCLYGLANVALESFARLGYSIGITGILTVLLSIALMVSCIVGLLCEGKKKDSEYANPAPAPWGNAGGAAMGRAALDAVRDRLRKPEGVLQGIAGAYMGAEIPVKEGKLVVLGRSSEQCNVVLDGGNVSRRHCTVEYDAASGKYKVTDYSKNGTKDENGNRLPEGRTILMPSGGELHIGDHAFRLG